jgi:hypothetical protein
MGIKRLFAITTISLAFYAPLASGKILDQASPPYPLLDSLAKKVDSKGIDVLRRWSHSSPSPRERPILAPLQEFTSASEAKTAQKLWMKDFKGNIQSFLVGIRDTHRRPTPNRNRVPPDLEEFGNGSDVLISC